MKKLTVYELFKGYNDIYIPPSVDKSTPVSISLHENDIQDNTVLFITEKVGAGKQLFDPDKLADTPLAIVVSGSHVVSSDKIPIIRAESVRAALSYALSNIYEINYEGLKFIGVTGTNGKTTTATLIYRILRDCGYKVGFIGTGKIISADELLSEPTYSMTTPDPSVLYPAIARMRNDGCCYIVMEVSSHSIALGKIAPITFEYAIFTNLGNDHLDFHGSKEEYFKTKLKLFKSARAGLFNLDDEYSRLAYKLTDCKKYSFGIIDQGDAYVTEIEMDLEKSSFYYRQSNLITKVTTSLFGAFNVYNSVAALRCVIDLGIKPCVAKRSLERIKRIDGRMEAISGGATVIIDYAHTPEAFYNCLKTLKQAIKGEQKLTVVFGCGGNRDRQKRPLFGKYAEMLADKIIITEDNSRNEPLGKIISDIVSGIKSAGYRIIEDREAAIQYSIENAGYGDIIAIIGKGHEKYKITKDGYLPFDEKDIATKALAKRWSNHEDRA